MYTVSIVGVIVKHVLYLAVVWFGVSYFEKHVWQHKPWVAKLDGWRSIAMTLIVLNCIAQFFFVVRFVFIGKVFVGIESIIAISALAVAIDTYVALTNGQRGLIRITAIMLVIYSVLSVFT